MMCRPIAEVRKATVDSQRAVKLCRNSTNKNLLINFWHSIASKYRQCVCVYLIGLHYLLAAIPRVDTTSLSSHTIGRLCVCVCVHKYNTRVIEISYQIENSGSCQRSTAFLLRMSINKTFERKQVSNLSTLEINQMHLWFVCVSVS